MNLSPNPMRSIPAWAGEPGKDEPLAQSNAVYPRVGGGTRLLIESAHSVMGLSPRGRGNRTWSLSPGSYDRSIPAWAGEPPRLPPMAKIM